ncbi:hypothetical protein F5876DRAFT_82964 [Lentinula aff. lateritia]|uniref:Uncharacterized protein n=1 Tax=Lentinula aff. lateritia TaxID=2804960 RepID=A0ACC1TIQ0_9AGAR|nr:hypothetical protein F5876DRAFT_82964 [Lentinula aff. lateritia]
MFFLMGKEPTHPEQMVHHLKTQHIEPEMLPQQGWNPPLLIKTNHWLWETFYPSKILMVNKNLLVLIVITSMKSKIGYTESFLHVPTTVSTNSRLINVAMPLLPPPTRSLSSTGPHSQALWMYSPWLGQYSNTMPVLAPISMPGISTILPQALQQMSVPPSAPPTQSVQIQTDPQSSPNPTILQPGTATADPKVIPLISITPPTPSPQGVTPPGLNFPKPAQSSKDTEKGTFPTPNTTPETWDGWLNGALEADLTWEELDWTGDLRRKRRTPNHASVLFSVTIISVQLLSALTLSPEESNASSSSDVDVVENFNICSHNHDRITHLLHLLPGEQTRFEELVDNNPDATPSQLLVGRRTLHGKIFMRSRLGGGFKRHMEPVNGIVSDAAHGFWREQNSLLITSSIYEAELHCWIPVLFSYSNGASSNSVTITDQYFIGILNFSQVERGGFMAAFVAFWMQQLENEHSEDELYRAAEVLLRGCEEHFRASVTRIKKIHSVVPVHSETHFKELALGLLSAKDLGDFHACAEVIHVEQARSA